MDNEKELLRLEDVRKEYGLKSGGSLKAVNGVTLSIAKGECVAVVGESGCGKSTLAKLAARIEPPTSGRICFDGADITGIRGERLRGFRRQVQVIFQDPVSVFSPRMKIGSFLMEPWINFEKYSRREAKRQALYALERVGLDPSFFSKLPHQLSGGELQRVAIARAIALHPELLICDEATSALDVSVQKQILELLQEHQAEAGCAFLFISHDLALAERFGNRVAVMYLGEVVEILEGGALKAQAAHPYTTALLESVFSIHDSQGKSIPILPGEPPSPIHLPEGCAFCARCRYAGEICRREKPKLQAVGALHQVACHRRM